MKIRWTVTPTEPAGADIVRYFSRPSRTEGRHEARKRIAKFVVRNKIVRFVYSINYKDPHSRWTSLEQSSHDSIVMKGLMEPLLAAEIEAAVSDD